MNIAYLELRGRVKKLITKEIKHFTKHGPKHVLTGMKVKQQ